MVHPNSFIYHVGIMIAKIHDFFLKRYTSLTK